MNYLELVNDMLIETDYSDQITSVVGLSDDELRAANWVRDAWVQIQRQEYWSFMEVEGTLVTTIGQDTYSKADIVYGGTGTVDRIDLGSFRNDTAQYYMPLRSTSRQRWQTDTGSARYVSVNPNETFVISPIPSVVETITMNTWSQPVELAANDDTPTLNPKYHKAIVWLAIANYAREQGGEWNGLRQAALQEYRIMNLNMSNDYLPRMDRKVGLLRY